MNTISLHLVRYGVAALTGRDRCHFYDRRHGRALAGHAN